MKKKRSVVNLFNYNNISELLTQPQSSSSSGNNQQQLSQSTNVLSSTAATSAAAVVTNKLQHQHSIPSSLCDTASAKRYSAFNNISFDTNLDFLSFVSLYRSFR
jgi:hypothetical protein